MEGGGGGSAPPPAPPPVPPTTYQAAYQNPATVGTGPPAKPLPLFKQKIGTTFLSFLHRIIITLKQIADLGT